MEKYTNKEIRKILKLEDSKYIKSLLTGIRTGKRWTHISVKHPFEKKSSLRKHSDEYIDQICQLISSDMKLKDMRKIMNISDSFKDKDAFKKLVSGIRKKRDIYGY